MFGVGRTIRIYERVYRPRNFKLLACCKALCSTLGVNLVWDRVNLRKILAHRVEPEEVEEAFTDARGQLRRVGRGGQLRRYQLIARTESGRYLRVIFERLPEGVRVVTAFDADDKDHRLYWRR